LIVGAAVMAHRTPEAMQAVADQLPPAVHYCSDGLAIYPELVYPEGGQHLLSEGKAETHTVECMNANLRTYLGRLKRKSRCFSRKLAALWQAIRLFVWHHNRRQRVILANPKLKDALTLIF
jgi:IS1 family transposase